MIYLPLYFYDICLQVLDKSFWPVISKFEKIMSNNPKILVFDIENSPNLGYIWAKYEQNVLAYTEEWYVLCWVAKWLDNKKLITSSLPDFKKEYKKDPHNDYHVVKALWDLFDEADIIIGHNGDRFDVRKMNARFVYYGMNPPSPYKTVDTLKIAKRYFYFNSNSLNDLGQYLKLGKKVETGGFALWEGCMQGNMKSWRTMIKYNKQDVLLLEKVYLELRKWMIRHPGNEYVQDNARVCHVCKNTKLQRRGIERTASGKNFHYRYQCTGKTGCGIWLRGANLPISILEDENN